LEDGVLVFEASWGLTGSLRDQLAGVRDRGYDGVEGPVPEFMARLGTIEEREVKDFPHLLADLGLRYLPMIFSYDPNFSKRWGITIESDATHESTFRSQLECAMAYDPIQITAHSGTDSMSVSEAVKFFEFAMDLGADAGITIGHETHRMRILYSPFSWRVIHAEIPGLKTVADLSHWINVCERVPDDLDAVLESHARSVIHIHGRVGHPEGPQVADPRAPENSEFLQWHERWWRFILSLWKEVGREPTFDPEYGPPPYLPTLPYTLAPVVEMLDIRQWQRERILSMWQELQ
jgi:sugar phosphate isomerase/epimerase